MMIAGRQRWSERKSKSTTDGGKDDHVLKHVQYDAGVAGGGFGGAVIEVGEIVRCDDSVWLETLH